MANVVKKQPTITTTIEGDTLTVNTVGHAPLVVRFGAMDADLNMFAALDRYRNKIVDAAALDAGATVADKHAAMVAVHARLMDGEWNATGDGAAQSGLLLSALVEFLGQPIDVVRATVATWDARTQSAMRIDPQILPIITRLRAARDAKKGAGTDTAAILAKMKAAA